MRIGVRCCVSLGILFLTLNAKVAFANCHLYLAQGGGFSLSLKTPKNSGKACKPDAIELELAVGGQSLTIAPGSAWQVGTGKPYTVTAVLTNPESLPSGGVPQRLTLSSDSFTQSASMTAVYTPAAGTIAASYEQDIAGATPEYVIRQLSLSLSGIQDLTLEPNGSNGVPMPVIELSEGQAPWFTSLPSLKDSRGIGTTTVTATFFLDPGLSDAAQAYIDFYGQAIKASWPGKISSTADLKAAVTAEQTWLAANPGPSDIDQYGGITGAWNSPKSNGYYQVVQHGNRWYLVSPLGNPLFYLGVTSVDPYSTPITPADTRGAFFSPLPGNSTSDSKSQRLYKSAHDSQGANFSFIVANQLQKYCTTDENQCTLPVPPPARAACPTSPCALTDVSTDLETVRLASWFFSGEGKFFSQMRLVNNPTLSIPGFPVLEHDASKLPAGFPAVDNLVSHPDPFDSKKTVPQLDAALQKQMLPYITDRNIVGWSIGNEKDEIIGASEIESILQMAGTVPAKQNLVLHALRQMYNGSYAALDAAWGISATTQQELYDAVPNLKKLEAAMGQPPVLDLEDLREFYEDAYYKLFRDRVQNIDQNHLYFGSWILSSDSTLASDWPLAAKYSDVVGFDDFAPGPLSSALIQLFATTDKPVLLGAWGVPTDYAGSRGFGWSQYTKAMTMSDSDSGDSYGEKLASLAASPYVVGAMVFDYYDEPLTGRGGSLKHGDPDDKALGTGDLEIGENFAFGLLDTTDTPKYDFVNKVRAANCRVLETLHLTTCSKK